MASRGMDRENRITGKQVWDIRVTSTRESGFYFQCPVSPICFPMGLPFQQADERVRGSVQGKNPVLHLVSCAHFYPQAWLIRSTMRIQPARCYLPEVTQEFTEGGAS